MFFRGQTIGKYKILSSLGSGGFGAVYLAEDTWIHKQVAIKVPHRQNIDFGELLREPRLLASLNHPNIVSVLTAEKVENTFFIVMEYVKGETLENLIAREGRLELPRAMDFACQICNGVDYAHAQNVIHRDLRPANVLVAENGLIKVADFGTSRFLEMAAEGTTVIGSPPYMSPEQFQGKAVFASDIYSLGITMYQMLSGLLPYDTPRPSDITRLMRGEMIVPLSQRDPRIPQPVNDVVMRAMAPNVGDRYQKASELLDALLALGKPAAARATGTGKSRPTTKKPVSAALPTDDSPSARPPTGPVDELADVRSRLKARETPQPRFCWHCRKPLHARSDRCPFCGEAQ